MRKVIFAVTILCIVGVFSINIFSQKKKPVPPPGPRFEISVPTAPQVPQPPKQEINSVPAAPTPPPPPPPPPLRII